jgi:hypothetical protein
MGKPLTGYHGITTGVPSREVRGERSGNDGELDRAVARTNED